MSLVRQVLTDLNISELITVENIVDDMIAYFERQDDHSQIRDAIKTRYGMGIKAVDDPNNSTAVLETYTKENFSKQVDSGMKQVISGGFGPKVVGALATLFTEPTQSFTLYHETQEDLEESEALLEKHRQRGGFIAALTEADKQSIQCGSSAVMVSYVRDGLMYQKVSPSAVRGYFGDTIEEDGQVRRVDRTDIEDATAIVIRLSQHDFQNWNYLAIFGASTIYPEGRHVQFVSSERITDIPAPYTQGNIEYEIDGTMCNPLTYYANRNPEKHVPEYPLAVIYSGITDSGDLMPTTTSLYNDCLEIDTAASHLLGCSQDAARGTLALLVDEVGHSRPLPRTLTGAISLQAGQRVEHIDHGADQSQIALDTLNKLMINVASGYSVPDYMIISEDHTLDASSGVALQVKTRPLKKAREHREEINRPQIRQLFEIEKYMLDAFSEESEAELNTLVECEQIWDSGELMLPENKLEKTNRIVAMMDKGLMDTITAIREYYQLPNDTEAIALYEKMNQRTSEYPPLSTQQRRALGLTRGTV